MGRVQCGRQRQREANSRYGGWRAAAAGPWGLSYAPARTQGAPTRRVSHIPILRLAGETPFAVENGLDTTASFSRFPSLLRTGLTQS